MKNNTEAINISLKSHQQSLADWGMTGEYMQELQRWVNIFRKECKLNIPIPALRLETFPIKHPGHYCPGRNGFGIKDEIAINLAYVNKGSFWQSLMILLHELLHLEEYHHGNPGRGKFHNPAFRQRAAELGLIVDERGRTECVEPPSAFFNFLSLHSIPFPQYPIPLPVTRRAFRSHKFWECECEPEPVKVYMIKGDFNGRCLKCKKRFRPVTVVSLL